LLPQDVRVVKRTQPKLGQPGDLLGVFWSRRTRDPFERRANGLLLAEDFARLELSNKPRKLASLAEWVQENGPVNALALYGGEPGKNRPWLAALREPARGFQDHLTDWLLEQERVTRFLGALVALSSAIGDSGVARPSDWEDAVYVPEESVYYAADAELGEVAEWEDAVRWQAFVLNPYVERALQPEVQTGWRPPPTDDAAASRSLRERIAAQVAALREGRPLPYSPPSGSEDEVDDIDLGDRVVHFRHPRRPATPLPLRPEVVYRWRSVLAPIYLQLYEALQRISERKMGAVLCRECGRPTLVLDGRKTSFCTPTEANRHKQRALYARNHGKPQPPRQLREVWHGGNGRSRPVHEWPIGPAIAPGLPQADSLDSSLK
jgi:hypothetical protein